MVSRHFEAIIRTVYYKKNRNVYIYIYIPITKDEKQIQIKTSYRNPLLDQWRKQYLVFGGVEKKKKNPFHKLNFYTATQEQHGYTWGCRDPP